MSPEEEFFESKIFPPMQLALTKAIFFFLPPENKNSFLVKRAYPKIR